VAQSARPQPAPPTRAALVVPFARPQLGFPVRRHGQVLAPDRVDGGSPDPGLTARVPNTRRSSGPPDHGGRVRAGRGRDQDGGVPPLTSKRVRAWARVPPDSWPTHPERRCPSLLSIQTPKMPSRGIAPPATEITDSRTTHQRKGPNVRITRAPSESRDARGSPPFVDGTSRNGEVEGTRTRP
jgi:hypothetical protein